MVTCEVVKNAAKCCRASRHCSISVLHGLRCRCRPQLHSQWVFFCNVCCAEMYFEEMAVNADAEADAQVSADELSAQELLSDMSAAIKFRSNSVKMQAGHSGVQVMHSTRRANMLYNLC